MMELIEALNQHYSKPLRSDIFDTNPFLQKEKEQIMNAYCDGAKGVANGTKVQHEFGWVSIYTRKKYYKQMYNQNK